MILVRNDVDHVLEKVFSPYFGAKIFLDVFLVGPVQVQLLGGNHDPAVASCLQFVAAEEPDLVKMNVNG